jgi:hypothetical protein
LGLLLIVRLDATIVPIVNKLIKDISIYTGFEQLEFSLCLLAILFYLNKLLGEFFVKVLVLLDRNWIWLTPILNFIDILSLNFDRLETWCWLWYVFGD